MTRTLERPPQPAVTGALRPAELATGSVMAALAVGFTIVGELIPVAGALQIVAIVPMAVIAERHRIRALAICAMGAAVVAFIAGGFGPALMLVITAVTGGIVGRTKRLRGNVGTVFVQSLSAGAILGGVTVGMLLILAPIRELFISIVDNSITGTANVFARVPALTEVATAISDGASNALRFWWVLVFASAFVSTIISALIAWYVLGAILDRLSTPVRIDPFGAEAADRNAAIDPLPVRLSSASFRYPGADANALTTIDLDIGIGQFVAIVGANGSGKSTLAKVLAGALPTSGSVERPGSPGLGIRGGTAMILQHPETQVLGSRVADDVVWGLPVDEQPTPDAVAALLVEVGLTGYEGRQTSGLSGGELQRLAVAAALARNPRLLIADEATAMIDPMGQRALVDVLASLPRRRPMSVVLITHRLSEADRADRVVHLDRGFVATHHREWMSPRAVHPPVVRAAERGAPQLVLTGVGHVYANRTPWATTALTGIDLTVDRGEGLLVVGGNGSGKSTLAWIMAGLTKPSAGTCELDGKAVKVGSVALSFQHARLQLQRRTVGEDIAAAGGPDIGSTQVSTALDSVGLDRRLAGRRIDELSGGQMRRVALAGLLIRRPKLLVLDEPLAGLDPPGRREITALLADLRRSGLTLVVISHDLDGMESVCGRTVVLEDGHLQTGAHA